MCSDSMIVIILRNVFIKVAPDFGSGKSGIRLFTKKIQPSLALDKSLSEFGNISTAAVCSCIMDKTKAADLLSGIFAISVRGQRPRQVVLKAKALDDTGLNRGPDSQRILS